MNPIKAKIQELVPEVMELKFGCEVQDLGIYIAKTPEDEEYYFVPKEVDVDGDAQVFMVEKWRGYTTLGSPLTLAVVLQAIGKRARDFVLEDGVLKTFKLEDDDTHNLVEFWNLADDNFDHQTPVLQSFIGELLGVNV